MSREHSTFLPRELRKELERLLEDTPQRQDDISTISSVLIADAERSLKVHQNETKTINSVIPTFNQTIHGKRPYIQYYKSPMLMLDMPEGRPRNRSFSVPKESSSINATGERNRLPIYNKSTNRPLANNAKNYQTLINPPVRQNPYIIANNHFFITKTSKPIEATKSNLVSSSKSIADKANKQLELIKKRFVPQIPNPEHKRSAANNSLDKSTIPKGLAEDPNFSKDEEAESPKIPISKFKLPKERKESKTAQNSANQSFTKEPLPYREDEEEKFNDSSKPLHKKSDEVHHDSELLNESSYSTLLMKQRVEFQSIVRHRSSSVPRQTRGQDSSPTQPKKQSVIGQYSGTPPLEWNKVRRSSYNTPLKSHPQPSKDSSSIDVVSPLLKLGNKSAYSTPAKSIKQARHSSTLPVKKDIRSSGARPSFEITKDSAIPATTKTNSQQEFDRLMNDLDMTWRFREVHGMIKKTRRGYANKRVTWNESG